MPWVDSSGKSTGTVGQQTIQDYIAQLTKQQESARTANIQRKNQILSIFDQIGNMFAPGGAMEQSMLGQLASQKRQDVGKESQALISSGLFNTTTAAGVGRKWEAQVGAPARLKLEDIQQQRMGDLLGQKAGFLERIDEPYPDMGTIAQLVMKAAEIPTPNAPAARSQSWSRYGHLR